MTDPDQSYDAPQDTGLPDSAETDPAALSSAEDLDEDRLRVDPLEEGMDPPEHWSAADSYGTTPWEQRHPAPLDDRLAEEQPDVYEIPTAEDDANEDEVVDASDEVPVAPVTDEAPVAGRQYGEDLGISADFAGGSVPEEIRTPPPAR
jgi:hypothetical protein